jgi:hypothetical protein
MTMTYSTVEKIYNRNYGSDRLFKRPYCQNLNYTQGVFDFQKTLNAFWVVDNMVSYMPTILKSYEENEFEFYVVEICLNQNHQGYMEVYTEGYDEDEYKDHIQVLKQEIPYIDLPLSENKITRYKFFLSLSAVEPTKFTFYLPSEY